MEISDNVKYYFYIELIFSLFFGFFSFFTNSKFVLFISLPMPIYNIYSFFKATYKIDFKIGDSFNNQKIFKKESLKYKIKFIIYISICSLSFIILFMRILYVILDKLLNEKEILYDIFKYFNIYEEKH